MLQLVNAWTNAIILGGASSVLRCLVHINHQIAASLLGSSTVTLHLGYGEMLLHLVRDEILLAESNKPLSLTLYFVVRH